MESIKAHLRFLKLSVRLKPTIIIGIDSGGLVLARILQRYINVFHKQKAVLDYLSFEIFFKDEGANKNKEVEASSHIRNLIIQDSVRDNLLRKENYIADKVKSFYIPVSPLIQANQNNEKQETFLTIRERYNLKEDTKLIVSFGSFDSWTGAQWIISAVEKGLPENMVFVIHSRNKFDESNPLHQKVIELSATNKQIILSEFYIKNQQTAISFLKQFDAGLVFYISSGSIYTGKNIYHIGNSSGKFSFYMAAHLPVIANNLPTYKALNADYKFGYIVEDENEFFNLIKQNPDFTLLKENCRKAYNEVLDPSKALDNYVDSLII